MNDIKEGDTAPMQSQIHHLDSDKLAERVRSLPRELFDKIYDLTFTTESEETWPPDLEYDIHSIERTYKPPSRLQNDRTTRRAFAKSYYGTGTECSSGTVFYVSQNDAAAWISSLTTTHVRMLKDVSIRDRVVLVHHPRGGLPCRLSWTYNARDFEAIAEIFRTTHLRALRRVISVQVSYMATGSTNYLHMSEPIWKKLDDIEDNGYW